MRSTDDNSGFRREVGNPEPVKFDQDTGSGGLTDGNSNQTSHRDLTESLDSSEPEFQQHLGVEGCAKGRLQSPETQTKHHIRI
ncbi:uncharacterized protein [Scyliorhinus torazame]|uniref:uncharacterized protein isoform X2 n=1 Tax=Scyliorhinus torazame TaxID=75743 RepID=UPI003B5AB111